MGRGLEERLSFKDIRKRYNAEQVLAVFNIPIENNKARCVFHAETEPSMHVYENNVYCYGCGESADTFALAKHLLKASVADTFTWFKTADIPEQRKELAYDSPNKYAGPVDVELVDYWHSQLTPEHYQRLQATRLLTSDTIDRVKLGWRPDWKAYSIPFWRPDGKVDTVQFRSTTENMPKYIGLKGHSRGYVQNADLLETPQDYVVVLLTSLCGLLARQDGLIAVSINGAFPFKDSERERVETLFAKQDNIYVVPDNTPAEFPFAYKLADWIGGQVKFFPANLPEKIDYTDYRRTGRSPDDFKREVLGILPETPVNNVEPFTELLKIGDPYNLLPGYVQYMHPATVYQSLAREIAQHVLINKRNLDLQAKTILRSVKCAEDFYQALAQVKELVSYSKGAW